MKRMMMGCLGSIDPYNHLLLHMDGVNGSTTYTDSSIYNRTVTRNGNATQSTTQIKFGASSSSHDGNGDYLSISGINPGTGAFCFEAWVYVSTGSRPNTVFSYGGSGSTRGTGFIVFTNWTAGATNLYALYDVSGVLISSTALATGSWRHIALCGNGGADGSRTLKLYLDGTQVGSTAAVNYNLTGKSLYIGANQTSVAESMLGYIDEVRITIGSERYTGNFTAPTAPFLT